MSKMRLYEEIVLVALLTVSSTANAESASGRLFKTLCVGEKSTGFNWEHNEWIYARFKPGKYIIEKLKLEDEPTHKALKCVVDMDGKHRYEGDDQALDYGCYNIREVGEKPSPAASELCLESWRKEKGQFVLDSVYCRDNGISFQPSGNFHAVQWTSAKLESRAKYKDSMAITVGKCSPID